MLPLRPLQDTLLNMEKLDLYASKILYPTLVVYSEDKTYEIYEWRDPKIFYDKIRTESKNIIGYKKPIINYITSEAEILATDIDKWISSLE